MSDRQRMYIGGQWCDAASGRTAAVINPATEETLATIPWGDSGDASRALSVAAEAFPAWRATNAWERGAILHRAADLMRERADHIAAVMSREVGKPPAESKGETLASAAQFEWAAEEGKRAYGRWVPPGKDGVRRWVLKQPVGVCAAISAWNFPLLLPSRKIAAATAAGCTIVSRPSLNAPLSAMEMIGCLHDAGLPPGVVNHVTGPGGELADSFLCHPACRKLSFTGSTEVGRGLIRASADRVVRLSLELGGSAPVLIFPDVDVDRVARETVAAKFRNNGQVCIAATRFYAHDDIYDEYVERAAHYAATLQVGDPFAEGTNCGPVCDAAAADKAEGMVADAVARGARVLAGGERPTGPGFERGFWYKPTVLVDVPAGARLTCEEVFGPVMPIFRFSSLEEGLGLANDTTYGLAGYVFTRDLQQAITVAEGLEFGIIGLNDMVPATAECPFGGMKESGQGREGGAEGIEDYLETKYVSVGMA